MKSALILLGLAMLVSSIRASAVPVFVWGKPSVTYVPALTQYSASEFSALVESQADDKTFTLVFAEERLSTEDFSQCKLKTQTCFRNLAKVERKSYLPNVEEPLTAFERESGDIQSVQLSADGSLSERIVPKGGAVVIVNLSGDDFASHDALIDSLYNRLHAEFPNILAIYTGKTPSFRYSTLIRHTRQAKQDDEQVPVKILKIDNNFLMAYESFKAGAVDALVEVSLETVTKNDANSSESTLQIDIKGPSASLTIMFEATSGSWEITGVTYDNTPYYLRHRVHLNQHFSYRCYSLRYYTLDMKKEIVLEQVQIQPFWASEDVTEFNRFGDSWDCIGFTTPGILTGLFLVFIFIFIGAYGITWMMDIRTMDRFDDPKGKTITINVAE
ncbi:V-type proton ATPase subunit S1 [Ochlerotatus camptorhynchus]|uniref:V-type proton ATPase subunit S1 n=1 Tax=Ochlerotatus camptorhynchus TaxID=644619 RepID=UPI0031D0E7A9